MTAVAHHYGGLGREWHASALSRFNPGAKFSPLMCERRQTGGGRGRQFMALPVFSVAGVLALGVSVCRKAIARRVCNGGACPAPVLQDEIQRSDSLMGCRPLSASVLGYVRSFSPWRIN